MYGMLPGVCFLDFPIANINSRDNLNYKNKNFRPVKSNNKLNKGTEIFLRIFSVILD